MFRVKDEAFCKAETEPYYPPVERIHPNMTVYTEGLTELSLKDSMSKATSIWREPGAGIVNIEEGS